MREFDRWLGESRFQSSLMPLAIPITADARTVGEGREPPAVDDAFLDFCTGILARHGEWKGTSSRESLREIGLLWHENRLEEAMTLFDRIEEISGNPWMLERPWRRYLDYAVHFAEHQARAIEAGLPPVLMVAFMKTASAFISTAFMLGLGMPACQLSLDYLSIVKPWLAAFSRGGAITHEHLLPTSRNIDLIAGTGLEVVVHLRHPCQVVLSYTHHLFEGRLPGLPDKRITEEGHRLLRASFDERLDWVIAHTLPLYMAWARGWAAARDVARVRFTTYEAFVEQPEQFFEMLCAAFGFPEHAVSRVVEQAGLMTRQTGRHNMRNKSSHEWRHVLTAAQKARCAESIPDDFWTLFTTAF